ncbi:MAG: glycoside hydrolase family 19 protein [Dehalococcoidia bacterium]
MTLTTAQLAAQVGPTRAALYLDQLNEAMAEFEITSLARVCAFLAQLCHESDDLAFMQEIASGTAYEGRADLGNTEPGDGVRFKGRGPIQLTGRKNYQLASDALGVDLVNDPALAASPDVGFRSAAWFWRTHGLNELADKAGDCEPPGTDQLVAFNLITRRINGGQNGAASRLSKWRRAKLALGVVAA